MCKCLPADMPVYCMCAVPAEARKGHHLLWDWIERVVSCRVGARDQTISSVRAASALTCWATSLSPQVWYEITLLFHTSVSDSRAFPSFLLFLVIVYLSKPWAIITMLLHSLFSTKSYLLNRGENKKMKLFYFAFICSLLKTPLALFVDMRF